MSGGRFITIHPSDNAAVAIEPSDGVPFGHKAALADIPAGGEIIKYGFPIGVATQTIKQGEHIHTHNMKTGLGGRRDYIYKPGAPAATRREPGAFMGFKRRNGKTGIRNEIWVIPTVGCVNAVGENIARRARALVGGSVGGIYCFPHPYGCSQLGGDHENTKKALCGLINHPNAGGVLVLGLGCENNHTAGIREMLGVVDENRVKFLVCQEHEDETAEALRLIGALIANAQSAFREPVSVSELIVGLKCGGSDGLSGITANPLLGAFTDRLISEGGSAILTEAPEMFGAEELLMSRCVNEDVFDRTVRLINDFKDYFIFHNQPVYENPSPGNKAGGITTLEEKSLGCTQKAGTAAVTGVLSYGEPLSARGLNLLEAPGNDLVASTALAVSGAQMVLFTTGRGTPFGAPVPTVKISSNTPLYNKKRHWIDFDAGGLIDGETMPETAARFYDYALRAASGAEMTKAEINGDRGVAIFKTGVTL